MNLDLAVLALIIASIALALSGFMFIRWMMSAPIETTELRIRDDCGGRGMTVHSHSGTVWFECPYSNHSEINFVCPDGLNLLSPGTDSRVTLYVNNETASLSLYAGVSNYILLKVNAAPSLEEDEPEAIIAFLTNYVDGAVLELKSFTVDTTELNPQYYERSADVASLLEHLG